MIVWLSSYPRSGNTFFRVILNSVFDIKTYSIYNDTGDIGADEATSEVVGHAFLPKDFNLDEARASTETYYIKTHELLEDMQMKDTDKVIYLVRDGRESSLSFTKHLQNFYGKENDDLSDVIYGNTPYGSWGQHVEQWENVPKLLIKFEELTDNPSAILHDISEYLNIKPKNHTIPTFEELQKVNPKFFRSGKKDSWKKAFSKDEHLSFWLNNQQGMLLMGYKNDMPEEINDTLFTLYASLFKKQTISLRNTFRTQQSQLRHTMQKQLQEKDRQLKGKTQELQQKNQQIEVKEKENQVLLNNRWYRFGQMSNKRKIWFIGKVISKKLKLYWLFQPIAKLIKRIFGK